MREHYLILTLPVTIKNEFYENNFQNWRRRAARGIGIFV